MTPESLIIFRHAQSIGNTMTQDERAKCETANHAYPLTDIGKQQAAWAGKYLKENFGADLPDVYFHSTFLRTKMTMDIILQELGLDFTIVPLTDSRLDEKWDGIFHELSKDDLEKFYPDQVKIRKRSGWYHYRAPGGESGPDVELRIRSFINDPVLTGKKVLIVGHGRWQILLQKLLHNLTVEEFLKLKAQKIPNCSVIEYKKDSSFESLPKIITPWDGHLLDQKTEFA